MGILDFVFKHNKKENNDSGEKDGKKFSKKLARKGGNTEYLLECPDCGYKEKYMIGTGHTIHFKSVFSLQPYYCPSCQKFLIRSYETEGACIDNTKIINDYCPKCGTETKKFDINKPVKLVCPKCKKDNVKVTNLESFWMT